MRDKAVIKTGALTLLETLIAMAIMACIFAALLPQFRNIQNSWDTKRSNSEIIQNSRILNDFLSNRLSKAVRITAVSDSSETNGYIQFVGSDDLAYRCEIGEDDYIQFGQVGDLSDLAGPVSRLQFSCYSLSDFDTTTTSVGNIRLVKVETTFTKQGENAEDKDFITNVYMESNGNSIATPQKKGDAAEFDIVKGMGTALAQIDATHYLLAYTGSGDDGYAMVLTVNADTGNITCGTEFEFDAMMGKTPALCQVDSTHYLCAYQGTGADGYAVILTVDTSDWTVSAETAMVFDSNGSEYPDLCQIDSTHYLCAYQGEMDDGYAVVLTVDTSTWTITVNSDTEFDTQDGKTPSLSQIDSTHYLCAYEGSSSFGKTVIFTVDTSDWSVSKKAPSSFYSESILTPTLFAIDSTHHLCVWQAFATNEGKATVLTVNDTTWTVSDEGLFEFGMQITEPVLAEIGSDTYLCAYESQGNVGSAIIIGVDTSDYSITIGDQYDFDSCAPDTAPDLCQINSNEYLVSYTGDEGDGWSVVLCLGIRP